MPSCSQHGCLHFPLSSCQKKKKKSFAYVLINMCKRRRCWKNGKRRNVLPLKATKATVTDDKAWERDMFSGFTYLLTRISPIYLHHYCNLLMFHNKNNNSSSSFNRNHGLFLQLLSYFEERFFIHPKTEKRKLTDFCLAAVLAMSRVSASGFTPYFFITAASENSLSGIRAETWQHTTKQESNNKKNHCTRKTLELKPITRT